MYRRDASDDLLRRLSRSISAEHAVNVVGSTCSGRCDRPNAGNGQRFLHATRAVTKIGCREAELNSICCSVEFSAPRASAADFHSVFWTSGWLDARQEPQALAHGRCWRWRFPEGMPTLSGSSMRSRAAKSSGEAARRQATTPKPTRRLWKRESDCTSDCHPTRLSGKRPGARRPPSGLEPGCDGSLIGGYIASNTLPSLLLRFQISRGLYGRRRLHHMC